MMDRGISHKSAQNIDSLATLCQSMEIIICMLYVLGNDGSCDDYPNAMVSNSFIEEEFKKDIEYVARLKCDIGFEVKNGQPLTAKCTYSGPNSGIWVPSSTCDRMRGQHFAIFLLFKLFCFCMNFLISQA